MVGSFVLIIVILHIATVLYIDEMWNLQAHLLDTVEMLLEYTGINLANELKDTLER